MASRRQRLALLLAVLSPALVGCDDGVIGGGLTGDAGADRGAATADTGHDGMASDLVAARDATARDASVRDVAVRDASGVVRDAAPTPDATDVCAGVTCSGHGDCVLDDQGQATCDCELYYKADGLQCVPACQGVDCGTDRTCVPGHHGVTDPTCVDICDCSNCGNCDAADFSASGAQAAYCGSDGPPATVACAKPCPSGQGCIPFTTPICWPMQGCFSL